MSPRERPSSSERDQPLLHEFAATFHGRSDRYALQRADGRYTAIKQPLTLGHVATHLAGNLTLGAYALDAESRARWLCLDADTDGHWQGLLDLARGLQTRAITPYLEPSRRGGHLWLFFEQPIPGAVARRFGQVLLSAHALTNVELFPKQDQLTTGPGSLVRLPLGIHRKTGQRYPFVTLEGEPLVPTLHDQLRILAQPEWVPGAYIAQVIRETSTPESTAPIRPVVVPTSNVHGGTLSERLKQTVSVYDFVSQYVTLDERGVGLCPFHDDHSPSFSVNVSENYWHCFAGCGGGSSIDFAMKWREKHGQDASFVATITALAEMLLQR